MNNMDKAIMKAFPLLAASTTGQIPAPEGTGMRYLVGARGIWRCVDLPWVHAVHQVGESLVRLPYGEVSSTVEFRCGALPRELIRQFAQEARAEAPTEIAAALIWNETTGEWRYARREAIKATADRIDYHEVTIADGEHLVVDVHSHGHCAAFFSSLDDKDDAGAMRVSLVLGNVDQPKPSSAMRLCMAGIFDDVEVGPEGVMEVAA